MINRFIASILFFSATLLVYPANAQENIDRSSSALRTMTNDSPYTKKNDDAILLSQLEENDFESNVNSVSVLIIPEDFTQNPMGRQLGAIGIVIRNRDRTYDVLTRSHVIDSCINRNTQHVYCNIVEVSSGGFPRLDPTVTVRESVLTAADASSDVAIIEFLGEFFNRQSTTISRVGSIPGSFVEVSGYREGDRVHSLRSFVVDQNYYLNNNCKEASILPASENLVYVATDNTESFHPGFSGGPIVMQSGEIIGVHGAQILSDEWPCSSFGFGANYDLIASNPDILAVLRIIESSFNWIHSLRLEFLSQK